MMPIVFITRMDGGGMETFALELLRRAERATLYTSYPGGATAVEVPPSLAALSAVAAYDDLNPVRAAVVSDPGEYHWSGWSARWARPKSRRTAVRGR